MNRPWKIWLVFAVCLAVLLAAMGWVSLTALRLARAQRQAQEQAELEERVRLALWRMDSMLSPLIAQESARPYFAYSAFYPAERAYGKVYNAPGKGDVLVPSPLLTQTSSNVLLHFQFGPDGRLTSPQVPEGPQRELAQSEFVNAQALSLAAARLGQFQAILAQQASPELLRSVGPVARSYQVSQSPAQLAQVPSKSSTWSPKAQPPSPLLNGDVLLSATPRPQPGDNSLAVNMDFIRNTTVQPRSVSQQSKQPMSQQAEVAQRQQLVRNDEELQARAQNFQQAYDLNLKNVFANRSPLLDQVVEGQTKPLWFGDNLVLVRRVMVQGREYVQGCWLDWAGLRRWLLDGAKDLIPGAALTPMKRNGIDPQAHMLAALPVRVTPGANPSTPNSLGSPIFFALGLAWACMMLATLAVAVLLHGAVSLSERRGAFVSAVTHELRTPLTTFKMYSEMLADGMVPDEARRRQYLETLCSEANRLSHLVENVLAYARLERGSARSRVEHISLGDLIRRVKPRLEQRAEQAGMRMVEDAEQATLATMVHVDVPAVEQILFNLVDNACKYAAPCATEKIIHLEALPNGGRAMLRVRDHGRGISSEEAKRLFRPFSKSAQQAAHSAPGVGLGLALCRRLSRSMGGDLRLSSRVGDGAAFELILPLGRGPVPAASIG